MGKERPVTRDRNSYPGTQAPPKPGFAAFPSWQAPEATTQARIHGIPVLAGSRSHHPSPDSRDSRPGRLPKPIPKPGFAGFPSWQAPEATPQAWICGIPVLAGSRSHPPSLDLRDSRPGRLPKPPPKPGFAGFPSWQAPEATPQARICRISVLAGSRSHHPSPDSRDSRPGAPTKPQPSL
ncbi:MAG: hypothetical protein ACOX5T_02780 [Candidatus Cryptobacteroides sp.]